ncbi:hypothetical protein MLD38_019131 [Melastoma candidum]|uniref:Uncharacterized protein n=1 Tax=Melastoma candidum TaxID=119954 RepID=A0ACB9QW11_9MYRT|nr:hypothetical protein MLD38_019131 [Melastoma candidum]
MAGDGDAGLAGDPTDIESRGGLRGEGFGKGGKEDEEEECGSGEVVTVVVTPAAVIKECLLRGDSSHEQCRICQEDKEEVLIDLGCHCRGGLAKAHKSCIDAWFRSRGSNKCEICQKAATNILPPDSVPTANFWVWRMDQNPRGSTETEQHSRACFTPLWVAFSILIGGLLLDVLISITLGVSALPVNIIIGVIVLLGLGTALRLALEFCQDWSSRRVVHRVDTAVDVGYPSAL